MHPDNLFLQNHGVTSPRLSNQVICDNGSANFNYKYNKNKDSENIIYKEEKQDTNIKAQIPKLNKNRKFHNRRKRYYVNDDIMSARKYDDGNDSQMSFSSDDSELSVGQEGCDDNDEPNATNKTHISKSSSDCISFNIYNNRIENASKVKKNLINNNDKDILINNNIVVEDDSESILSSDISDNCDRSLSTSGVPLEYSRSDQQTSSVISDRAASEELSNDSSPSPTNQNSIQHQQHQHILLRHSTMNCNNDIPVIDPLLMAANGLRLPVLPTIVRPSPTLLQEEFLRKSHLYAEELMKQQMHIMAAARVSAFTHLRNAAAVAVNSNSSTLFSANTESKVGFKPHVKQSMDDSSTASTISVLKHDVLNFSEIQTNLTTISKITGTENIQNNNKSLNKFNVFNMSSPSSHSKETETYCSIVNNDDNSITNNNNNNNNNNNSDNNNYNNNSGTISNSNKNINSKCTSNENSSDNNSKKRNNKIDNNRHNNNLTNSIAIKSLNQRKEHLQHLHEIHPFFNNNFHDSNLKFSIDNILKDDFGRRIEGSILKGSGNLSSLEFNISGKKKSAKQTEYLKNKLNQIDTNTNLAINSTLSSVSSTCSSDSSSTININERINIQQNSSPLKSPKSSCSSSAINNSTSTTTTSNTSNSESGSGTPMVWPAWVYCTRYSDRPSSGPRTKKPKKIPIERGTTVSTLAEDKRPRTAFSGPQLARLKHEFAENRYLTEKRRQQLSSELGLNEAQIKIWFQNKRAKIKKSSGSKNPLALQLMAQGLYNHSTVPLTREEEELQELHKAQNNPV